jgi:capsular polysaccharide transport system permease protein
MNMHGFITPAQSTDHGRASPAQRAMAWIRKRRIFMLVVVLPTLLTGLYLYLIAADQYQTEAHFVIQSSTGSSMPMSIGDVFGFSGPVSSSQSQAMGVSDYLGSQEAVDTLQKQMNLVQIFRRPEADMLAKLHPANPTPEHLHDYYENRVLTHYNRDTGISTLEVRAFRPADSYALIQRLLALGEERVNQLNQRSYNDSVRSAQRQVDEAEQNARDIERRMTAYRQGNADVDPTVSGTQQSSLLMQMQGSLASARSQLSLMGTMIDHNSPQYRAMQQRVAALEAEVGRQKGQLTGSGSTVASRLGGYEDLKVRQAFAGKRYEAASAALEKARETARRQSLYLLRIVDPSMPVKALYPKRAQTLLTVLLTLLVAYAIGWLIVAGVREHSA